MRTPREDRQMVGRGTRLHPDKKDLMVVDVADNSRSHALPGLHSLFNLPARMNLEGKQALLIEREIAQLNRERPWIDISRITTPDEIQFAAERIAFFNFDPPVELAGHTSNVWYTTAGGYRLKLPNGKSLTIESNLLDTWDVFLTQSGRTRLLVQADSLWRAAAIADTFVSTERPDAVKVVERGADWRAGEPTEKQREPRKRGIPFPEGLTKGQASQMISYILSIRG